ncbi:chromosome partitioning protein, ParB family [Desulfomicrobium norvegicum]|uniref:Chromosome partitioning protein, ParB family n=1 Tax=Desulfomicrobium norvegicum (strain DSM 1741 / NCIMB 8310) TaxID=52561 RepID=A0A8G2C414_DESNO|nr:ParB/RepB/Spo0J family partition protein [Desulfomicrobium norvegicum]SFL89432.1 chromosome partitioning protein, ParB family [Desulfomicrobium norvegicum]
MGKYKCGKIYKLTVSELKINTDQPRKLMEENEFQKLVDSIQKKGLIHPIVVKELEDGTISIVSGSRRYKAHKLLNLKKIPAWFTDGDPAELGLVENLIREDLSQMEVAEALQKLKDKSVNKTQVDLAKLIGKAESTVSELLSLRGTRENGRGVQSKTATQNNGKRPPRTL